MDLKVKLFFSVSYQIKKLVTFIPVQLLAMRAWRLKKTNQKQSFRDVL